jgi:two-component system, OmpR family, response regulator TctD
VQVSGAQALAPKSGESGLRLLVVDDEEQIVEALRDYFSGSGYTVDGATEAAVAMSLLDRNDYVAIVTDLRLSACNRYEGLGILAHARRRNPGAACIVLTAYGDTGNETQAEERGADALVQKPAPLPYLAARLAEVLLRKLQRTHVP